MNKAKPVIITALTARFYIKDGWTRDILEQYLIFGDLSLRIDNDSYFILDPESRLNVGLMIHDGHVGALINKERWAELRGLSDIEILKQRSW